MKNTASKVRFLSVPPFMFYLLIRDRLMVGHLALDQAMQVRILLPDPSLRMLHNYYTVNVGNLETTHV